MPELSPYTDDFDETMERDPKPPRPIKGDEFEARLDLLKIQRLWQMFEKGQITPEHGDGVMYIDTDTQKIAVSMGGKWINLLWTSTSTSSTSTSSTSTSTT